MLVCFTNLNVNSKSNLKNATKQSYLVKLSNNMQHLKTASVKSTTESNSSLLFLQEIKIEEVEEFEENLLSNKSKYFFVKNKTSFFYKNLVENNLLSIKEEVLFKNFITTSSFIRLYKRFQVYKI